MEEKLAENENQLHKKGGKLRAEFFLQTKFSQCTKIVQSVSQNKKQIACCFLSKSKPWLYVTRYQLTFLFWFRRGTFVKFLPRICNHIVLKFHSWPPILEVTNLNKFNCLILKLLLTSLQH